MNTINPLSYYINCFENLNSNRNHGRTAPHKAVLLLAVIEGVERGKLTNGFIPCNDYMVNSFKRCWNKYVGDNGYHSPKFEYPFFHLDYEHFWHLMPTPEYEAKKEYSLKALRKSFWGAKIDDALADYMEQPAARARLRKALLDKFFPQTTFHEPLTIVAETHPLYPITQCKDREAEDLAA